MAPPLTSDPVLLGSCDRSPPPSCASPRRLSPFLSHTATPPLCFSPLDLGIVCCQDQVRTARTVAGAPAPPPPLGPLLAFSDGWRRRCSAPPPRLHPLEPPSRPSGGQQGQGHTPPVPLRRMARQERDRRPHPASPDGPSPLRTASSRASPRQAQCQNQVWMTTTVPGAPAPPPPHSDRPSPPPADGEDGARRPCPASTLPDRRPSPPQVDGKARNDIMLENGCNAQKALWSTQK